MILTYTTPDGGEAEIPARYEVCEECEGKGTHTNRNIDGNGLTWEDIDELGGDDFMEDYLGGVYDVRCEECHGERVVLAVDRDRASPQALTDYDAYQYERWAYEQECANERRMGY